MIIALQALHALKAALPESGWLADPAAAGERITDVKTALRHALGPQLGRALGWQVLPGTLAIVDETPIWHLP